MCHTSPASFLVWSIFSTMLGAFLLYHLWSFDKFKCLRWNNGPYAGAFKRVMTYTYLLTIPLIMTFSLGFAIIKYIEGYSFIPGYGIIPTPFEQWSSGSSAAIFPLMLIFSVAWSLEMVTHLEELCFWLFLVNAGSAQQDWFRSVYFKTWLLGSTVAVTYMPLVTIFTRQDPLKGEAYTFLAGSMGSLSLTLWFTPILWTFPSFLNSLREENVDASTIIRLTKFHELNTLRILFRFMFTVPLFILGVDGVRSHQHINESAMWTDLLTMCSAFGCAASSGITLVIFFPRSIEGEISARDQRKGRPKLSATIHTALTSTSSHHTNLSRHSFAPSLDQGVDGLPTTSPRQYGLDEETDSKMSRYEMSQTYPSLTHGHRGSVLNQTTDWSIGDGKRYHNVSNSEGQGKEHRMADGDNVPDPASPSTTNSVVPHDVPLRPNRRVNSIVEMGYEDSINGNGNSNNTTKSDLSASTRNKRNSTVHAMVHNFRSPIDVVSMSRRNNLQFHNNDSRLTFTRRI